MTRRGGRTILPAVAAVAAAAHWWLSSGTGGGFVAGGSLPALRSATSRRRAALASRRAGFSFGLATSEDHQGLVTEPQEEPGVVRVSTHGGFMTGNWNTVLGDAELPASGRAYWEVKIVRKPSDAWEYIGVVEPSADVTVPLTRNKKGAGWFWGSTYTDSFMYTYLAMKPEFNAAAVKHGQEIMKTAVEQGFQEKEIDAKIKEQTQNMWKGVAGTHVGMISDHPPFDQGTVVGVDVDMGDGSLAFWADGKFLGKVRDTEGKPVSLKGKKVVPAVSVYGRTTGGANEFGVMEVRTGLEPPPRP